MSIVVDTAPEGVAEQVTETQEVVQDVQEQVEDVTTKPEYIPPEKYAGKTLEDVIGMHQNVEKAFGKQGQEVGDQRQLISQLIEQSQANQATETTEEAVSFEDTFYDDPAKAVNSAIENHPEIIKAREGNVKSAQGANLSQLEATHPDFMDVVGDSNFRNI